MPDTHGHILVVDDYPMNRMKLSRFLQQQGHTVTLTEDGKQAVAQIDKMSFDLMLLDIEMPEMDGYQVLAYLKQQNILGDLPVIVISAADEMESVVKCIEMGAEDHLPKPFNPTLLNARIGACLEKKRLRDLEVEYLNNVALVTKAAAEVEANTFEPKSLAGVAAQQDELGRLARVFGNMVREVRAREAQLKHARDELQVLNQAKAKMIDHLSHELKTPLAIIATSIKLLSKPSLRQDDERFLRVMNTDMTEFHVRTPQDDIPEDFFRELDIQFLIHELKDPTGIVITVFRSMLEKQEKYGPLTPRQENALKRGLKAILQTREMLNDLLEVGRSEAGQFEDVQFQPKVVIYACLLDALELMEGDLFEQAYEHQDQNETLALLANAGIHFNTPPELDGLEIVQDETKFRQIVGNLIKNALRFKKTRLDIRCDQRADMLWVEVEDDGPGITPEEHDLIFQQYTQAKGGTMSERKGHGLGLAGAFIQARRLGGNVVVQSEAGKGAQFRFTIPVKVAL